MNGERMLRGESRAPDYFEQIELESSFDELREITIANVTNLETIVFDWIRWQHLGGLINDELLRARVGATKQEDGTERTFTFKGEFEDLYKLLIARKEDVG